MYVFEYGDEIVVIDCGLMFPDEEMFGIDLVIPDVTYLKERRANVKAFLITHAHEDHVGAPAVRPARSSRACPVYASTLARGLLGNKIKEHKLHNNPLLAARARRRGRRSAPFTVMPFRVGHSIPDAMGIALRTPVGDDRPHRRLQVRPHPGRRQAVRLRDPGQARRGGRRSACCPTRPAPRTPATRPSERTVGEAFREIMEPLEGRVIVATFASNIARIQQVLDAAADVRPQGRGHRPLDGAELPDRDRPRLPEVRRRRGSCPRTRSRTIPDDKLVIATTGAQGEPMAGLARMANRDHRFVEIQPGDTVIVSASPIPGNEEYVARTIDNLFKAGANVFYHTIKRAHVSGHASQEELKLMLGLTKPKHFIPIHGEFRMQVQHGRLAIETGVAPENVFIIENGTPIEIYADGIGPARQPGHGRLRLRRRAVGRRGRRRRAARPAGARQRRHVHDRRDRRQADRHRSSAGPRSSPAASSTSTSTTRSWRRRSSGSSQSIEHAGRPHQRDRPAQDPDQGRRLALPVRADEAAADGLPGRRRGLSVATRRRAATRKPPTRPSRARRRERLAARGSRPEVVRSIVGLVLLVLGAMTLIALILPGRGRPDDWWTRRLRAVVRDGALAAAVLPAARRLVARVGPRQATRVGLGHHPRSGWRIAYAGILGAAQVLGCSATRRPRSAGAWPPR